MDSVWQQIIGTIRLEFSDLGDVEQFTRVTVRLTVAVALGALIGFERERRDSFAGLRTHMLVALGSTLFVVVPQLMGTDAGDMTRVLQGVVAGIGFLGAGAVLKQTEQGQIHGLTTAASIWATAAIGVAVGLGREATAILATVMVLAILALVYRLDRRLERRRSARG